MYIPSCGSCQSHYFSTEREMIISQQREQKFKHEAHLPRYMKYSKLHLEYIASKNIVHI